MQFGIEMFSFLFYYIFYVFLFKWFMLKLFNVHVLCVLVYYQLCFLWSLLIILWHFLSLYFLMYV